MVDKKSGSTRGGHVSRKRRTCFIIAAILIPACLFGGIEWFFRARGHGGYPDFLRTVGQMPDHSTLWMVEPAASKPYFFANPQRPGYAEQYDFVMPKPAGTLRVFLFGESAAKGYPQPRNLAISAFLQSMLSDVHPDKKVEVINLGTTAIASFPIRRMVDEAIGCSPDLFVFYVGNNEFFGAYGTASINSGGLMPPPMLEVIRAVRGLGTAQVVDSLLRAEARTDQSLMEQMVDRTMIPHDSNLRHAAARNLEVNLSEMVRAARRAGVPALVCTTASNESGMAPIGEEASADAAAALAAKSGDANGLYNESLLRDVLDRYPHHARAHFMLGKTLMDKGRMAEAREAFLQARDLDTMPWRPTREIENAVRSAATREGAVLCDIAEYFRSLDSSGTTGWDLVDDHVHMSLRGQAEAARCIVKSWAASSAGLSCKADSTIAEHLPDWKVYASRQGSNEYDEYRVNHTLRVIFDVPFMRQRNAEAHARYSRLVEEAESRMDSNILQIAREWQTSVPHAGGLRPLVGMVAREHLKRKDPHKAKELYHIAVKQVPAYTSWNLEYSYSELACRELTEGALGESEKNEARAAIERGRMLLAKGFTGTGMTERHVGRLHQLLGEFKEAVPYLEAARKQLHAEDFVACEQALVLSYVRCGRHADAMAIAERGVRDSGKFAAVYEAMIRFISKAR